MNRSDNRIVTVLLAMLLGLTILAAICFATVFLQPNLPFNPLSPDRATSIAGTRQAGIPTVAATNTPPPTYPPTWTPSPTFTPPPTKTSTNTATVTPTRTPSPTSTPFPTATSTLVVVPTSAPPPPYPYIGASGNSENNCANIKLRYTVSDQDGEPVSGFEVEYGESAVSGSVFRTEETRFSENYGVTLIPGSDRIGARAAHDWFAYLIENDLKISKAVLFTTDPLYALPEEECVDEDDDGDISDEELEGCILNPCTSEDAVNIKHIDFRPQFIDLEQVTPTPRPNLCTPPFERFVIARTCSDCPTQQTAQQLFEIVGGPEVDIYDFDRDGDGYACEDLPIGQILLCSNYATQAEAQAAYEFYGGANRNTYRLDPDQNGIACEELP
jgi:hypothetical protein